jgi:threonine dehydratase
MDGSTLPLPAFADVLAAAARIAPHAHVTPVLRSRSIDALVGAELHFKAEHLQRIGAFKFRGACNAVWALADAAAARGVVTHSSGNHGAALALAARDRGIPCHVVVPEGAVRSKLVAIEAYGATLHHCAATIAARESMCADVQRATGAVLVHPYADGNVIAGQGTARSNCSTPAACPATTRPATACPRWHARRADRAGRRRRPRQRQRHCRRGAGTTLQGLCSRTCRRRGHIRIAAARHARHRPGPDTICDGLRGTLGAPNFALLRAHAVEVLTVDDAETVDAMRLLWTRMKQVVEPSSATVLAALLRHRERFAGQRVGVILSGGNVDPDALSALFAGKAS